MLKAPHPSEVSEAGRTAVDHHTEHSHFSGPLLARGGHRFEEVPQEGGNQEWEAKARSIQSWDPMASMASDIRLIQRNL